MTFSIPSIVIYLDPLGAREKNTAETKGSTKLFHSHISEAVWGGGNAQYRNSPYRQIAPADQFFQSQAVWKHQQNLNRYILARWGYSRSLAIWFVIDEINGTEGWEVGGAESAEAWCQKMHDCFHEHDPYRRPTTGTQSGGGDQWWPGGYRIFDIAAREIYEAQGHPMPRSEGLTVASDHPLRTSDQNYAKQTQNLWHGFAKPCILGECGWDPTYYEPGTPGYLAMVHNAPWATLACGRCMGPFWWSYSPRVNGSIVTNQLGSCPRFARDIDLARKPWNPAKGKTDAADMYVMMGDREAFGWLANPGKEMAGASIEISGLPDDSEEYDLYFYHTWRGAFLEPIRVRGVGGSVRASVPELRTTEGRANHLGGPSWPD
jgi:hypothetical protein